MKRQLFWCIHCERVFESDVPDDWTRGWFIEEVGKPYTDKAGQTWYECPYEGCSGSSIDFIPWEDMREDDPSLPVKPEKGVVYSPCYDGFPDLGATTAPAAAVTTPAKKVLPQDAAAPAIEDDSGVD
jgi:hypothetical protein